MTKEQSKMWAIKKTKKTPKQTKPKMTTKLSSPFLVLSQISQHCQSLEMVGRRLCEGLLCKRGEVSLGVTWN